MGQVGQEARWGVAMGVSTYHLVDGLRSSVDLLQGHRARTRDRKDDAGGLQKHGHVGWFGGLSRLDPE
eukprot:scaffold177046_cov30-Tisochrysis_lutea.AAC.4